LLQLEVIAGPSAGSRLGQKQGGGVGVSVTVGRIAQNDLVLNDPEVSGKHVAITWNLKVSFRKLFTFGGACFLSGGLIHRVRNTCLLSASQNHDGISPPPPLLLPEIHRNSRNRFCRMGFLSISHLFPMVGS